jgi:uncharacterized protein YjbI with pentapeptide repeats
LDGQVLTNANLSESDLRSAWLERTNFEHAMLKGTSLAAVNASLASFVKADLREAVMRAGISRTQTSARPTSAALRSRVQISEKRTCLELTFSATD